MIDTQTLRAVAVHPGTSKETLTMFLLKAADEIDRLKRGEWISVKERLPDAEGRYFATDGYKVGEGIFLDGKMYACDLSPFLTEDITHWQPLPEPPKEE